MKWTTFSIFCIFYLALMLFAERRPAPAVHQFSAADDLSNEMTILHAPAEVQSNGWTAAQIPPQRLVAPLVRLEAGANQQITLREIVRYEKKHGTIPPGALVVSEGERVNFDFDSLRFLAEGRDAYGIAATGEVDFVANAPFIAAKGMYVIDRVALPASVQSGAVVMIAPEKSQTAIAPVRLIALEQKQ
jgi:hypothetical protein